MFVLVVIENQKVQRRGGVPCFMMKRDFVLVLLPGTKQERDICAESLIFPIKYKVF